MVGTPGRISRRRIIKAGAAAGGLMWVAPVIDSFTTPAAAASGPPSGSPPSGSATYDNPGNNGTEANIFSFEANVVYTITLDGAGGSGGQGGYQSPFPRFPGLRR